MSKLHKIELYIVDVNGEFDNNPEEVVNYIEQRCSRDLSLKMFNHKHVDIEWDDDIDLNRRDSTKETCEKYFNKVEVKMEPHTKYGTLYTLEEFISCVECGGFIDYDGHGDYATSTEQTNIIVIPSDILMDNIDRRWTHVMWYNR